jgi:hypothetical protein
VSGRTQLILALASAAVAIVALFVVTRGGGSSPKNTPATTVSTPAPAQTTAGRTRTTPATTPRGKPPAAKRTTVTVTAPASTPAATTPAPPPPPTEIGVNVNDLFNTLQYSPAQIAAQLALVRATGVEIVRSDALWEATEPKAPAPGANQTFDWAFDDLVAGSIAQAGLTWLPIVDYCPQWAASYPAAPHSLPRDPVQYAAFARALAARYGPGGSFWSSHKSISPLPATAYEIWNEPDQREFAAPAPNAGAYAALYTAARVAIDAVQPSATVIVGGLTDAPAFIPALVKADPGLAGHVDGIGLHPYAPTPAGVDRKVVGARAAITAAGLGAVPLYVTEFGWSTQPVGNLNYAPAGRRPALIKDALDAIAGSGCDVRQAYIYTWLTPEAHPADLQDWFGLSHPNMPVPDADTDALAAAVAATRGHATAC